VSPVLPEIRTERLLLRRLWPTDEDKVVALYRDEEANQWDPMAFQPEQVRERFTGWVADWDDYGLSYWLAEATDNGAVVGMGGVRHHVEGGERVLNLAYRLHRNYWGQGYATEIARPAVEWAEQEMPDVPVSIVTTPQHAASLRVAEKLGFTVWRERSQHGFDEVLLRRQR
jgi:RimJ/RimL family protein N-acetyltransferase